MPAGGARAGAGRPKGRRTMTTLKREKEIRDSGLAPLDYLLKVLRDEKEESPRRLEAAKAAAPYVHPRLNAVTHKGDDEQPVRVTFEWQNEES